MLVLSHLHLRTRTCALALTEWRVVDNRVNSPLFWPWHMQIEWRLPRDFPTPLTAVARHFDYSECARGNRDTVIPVIVIGY